MKKQYELGIMIAKVINEQTAAQATAQETWLLLNQH
jgi:hypothetical protein